MKNPLEEKKFWQVFSDYFARVTVYLPQCLQKAAKLLPFFLLWVCFCSVWEAEKRCDWKVKKSKRSSVLFLFRWALENAGSSTHLIDKTCTIYIQAVFKRGSLRCVSCHLNYLQPCAWSLLYARAISQYLKKLCVCPLSVGITSELSKGDEGAWLKGMPL